MLTSRKSGPARASPGFQAVTVPTYSPGDASAGGAKVTGISVSRDPATTLGGADSHDASLLSANCDTRTPVTCRTRKVSSVSPGPARPLRRNAADPLPVAVSTT